MVLGYAMDADIIATAQAGKVAGTGADARPTLESLIL